MNIEGDNLIAWGEELERQNERLRAALELARDAVEWNDPERNGVLIRIKMALANEEGKMTLPWQLRSYAQYCIRSDWTHEAKGDREWAEVLALAIDKFAKGWLATNCAGRQARK